MSTATVRGVVRRLGLAESSAKDPESDAALLTRYTRHTDHTAFAELLRRHGPVVFGACRRILNDVHDAEDAFQATFLVLAVKASSVRPPGSVGGWLYGVAVNVARKAKVAAARRWRREMASILANGRRQTAATVPDQADLRAILDEELGRLPAILRDALVLCDLNERTRSEAARELGCPEGTIAARLHRARKMLGERLTRRGIALPAAGITALLAPEIVSAALTQSTLAATVSFVADASSALVSPTARTLAEGVMRTAAGKFKLIFAVLAVGLLTSGGLLWGADRMGDQTTPVTTTSTEPQATPAEPPAKREPLPGYVTDVCYSPDGKFMAVVAGGKVAVSVTDFKPEFGFGPVRMTVPGEAAAFKADAKTLLVMGTKVQEYDLATGKVLREHPRPKTNLGWNQVAFSPDGKRYAAHFGFGTRVYDTATGFEPVRLDNQHEPGSSAFPGTVGKQILFSPDGKRIAAVGVLIGEGKMGAAIWDAETGKRLHDIEADFKDGPRALTFSPDGKTIVVGGSKSAVQYDAATFKEIRHLGDTPGSGPITSLAYSPDGKRIAIGFQLPIFHGGEKPIRVIGHKTEVQVLDLATGKEIKRFDGFEDVNHMGPTKVPVTALAFSPDGKTLTAGTGFPNGISIPNDVPKVGEVRMFSLSAENEPGAAAGGWKEKQVLELDGFLSGSAAYSPDGKTVVVGGTFGHVHAYDTATWKKRWTYQSESGHAAVAFSPDAKTVGITYREGVRFLDAATGKFREELKDEGEPATLAIFRETPSGVLKGLPVKRVLLGYERAYTVKIGADWSNVSTIRLSTVPPGTDPPDRFAVPLAVDPRGNHAVVKGPIDQKTGKNVLWAWAAGGSEGNKLLAGHTAVETAAAWSADASTIVTADADGLVLVWDATTFKQKARIELGGRAVAVAVTADGKRIAVGIARPIAGTNNYAEEVLVCDTADATYKATRLSRHEAGGPFWGIASLAFSPDGKELAATFCNFSHLKRLVELRGHLRIFALEDPPVKPEPEGEPAALNGWQQIKTFADHDDFVDGVAFSQDGRTFATAGGGTVIMWDRDTRKKLWSYKLDKPAITAIAYSSNGLQLAVSHKDGATLLNAVNGKREREIEEKDSNGSAIAFAPVNKLIDELMPRQLAFTNGRTVWVKSWIGNNGPVGEVKMGPMAGTAAAQGYAPASVAWSPAGDQLVYNPNRKIDPMMVATGFPSGNDPKQAATHYYAETWGAGSGKRWQVFLLGTDPVTAVAWSPDGKQVALGSSTGDVALFDAATNTFPAKELRRMHVGGRSGKSTIHTLAFSPDSRTLAAGLEFDEGKNVERVVMFETATGKRGQDLQFFRTPPVSLSFSPDGRTLLVGCGHKEPFYRDKPAKERVGEFQLWSLDPERKTGPVDPESIEPMDAAAPWREKARLTDVKDDIISVAFSPDGKFFSAGGENGTAGEWHSESLERTALYTYDDVARDPAAVAYSPDGKTRATTFRDGTYWHSRQGLIAPRASMEKDSLPRAVAYGPFGDPIDGRKFNRLAYTDGRAVWVKTWYDDAPVSTASFGPLKNPPAALGGLRVGLAFSADGKQLVFIPNHKTDPDWITGKSKDKKEETHWFAQVWGGGSGAAMAALPHGTQPVTAVAWSKDGTLIATGGADGNVILWDSKSFKEVRRAALGKGTVESLAFAPDSKSLAAAFVHETDKNPNRVVMLDLATGKQIDELASLQNDHPRSVAFAPDGKSLIVGCGKAVRVFTTEPAK